MPQYNQNPIPQTALQGQILQLFQQTNTIGNATITAGTWLSGWATPTSGGSFSVAGILATLFGLANSSWWLNNNGSWALSYSTPTKTDVGLGNVANVDQTNATNITSWTLGTARLGSGTANSSSYLRWDSTWHSISWSVTYATTTQITLDNNSGSTPTNSYQVYTNWTPFLVLWLGFKTNWAWNWLSWWMADTWNTWDCIYQDFQIWTNGILNNKIINWGWGSAYIGTWSSDHVTFVFDCVTWITLNWLFVILSKT